MHLLTGEVSLRNELEAERIEMRLREYNSSDCNRLAELFYQTVHCINAKDYTGEQLNAWATDRFDIQEWDISLRQHKTIVAVIGTEIAGFGDIDSSSYPDRLYVHKDHQRKGTATAICDKLERFVGNIKVITHASITAKPFFEHRGYRAISRQEVLRNGISLTNYIMEYTPCSCEVREEKKWSGSGIS